MLSINKNGRPEYSFTAEAGQRTFHISPEHLLLLAREAQTIGDLRRLLIEEAGITGEKKVKYATAGTC